MESCYRTQGAHCDALRQPRGWDGIGGGVEVQEGGNICIPMAGSC